MAIGSQQSVDVGRMTDMAFINSITNDLCRLTKITVKITMYILIFISYNQQFGLQVKCLFYEKKNIRMPLLLTISRTPIVHNPAIGTLLTHK